MGLFGTTCPVCKKAKMKRAGRLNPIRGGGKYPKLRYGASNVLVCPKCGYRTLEQ